MWLSSFSLKFLFSLAHLILSRLLLEALGPCCRHDEVVAVARYFVSCLLIRSIGGWLLCPVTTPNISVSSGCSPALSRGGEGQPVTTLRPSRLILSISPESLFKLSQLRVTLYHRFRYPYTLSVVTMPAPHSHSDMDGILRVTLTAESDKGWVQLTGCDTR